MKNIFYLVVGIFVVLIIIPMILIYSCDMNVSKKSVEDKKTEEIKIRVYLHETKRIKEVELEEYVKGVVASEMPATFELEALKAQAMAARTKALYQKIKYGPKGNPAHPGAEVCDDVHCQVYRSREKLKEIKGEKWFKKYWPKIEEAVESTRGLVITYNGKLIDPLYHSTSGGRTENSEDVFETMAPYLRSVDSPYEQSSKHLESTVVISTKEFVSKINSVYKDSGLKSSNIVDSLKVLERTEGGDVKRIRIGNKVLSGRKIREILGLRSADFQIIVSGDKVTIKTRGYGHGVGMSQYGADGMAKRGYKFDEIIKHYYQGVEIEKFKK
ncbi:stage II sporulation protein D [Caminicella sporogenes DSM 14501]|uniref:Stage II sporulation protein D n=1 Tax=Caminicella sporogenes DSM 14501 TaxID=1121266 RepID=A0A1M6PUR6_9FIRM|nr:stage II sporulation protein D [Caminicella sporogenes]RKD21965.1 stage II sporulation protein D [Caminicella sporogenes]SHK11678.1 stage II sporulation protein D [Caminicella sporogenes DSM 14501]